jgi:hypothetical protein
MDTMMHRYNYKWQYIDTWLNNTISKTLKHKQGPGWINQLGATGKLYHLRLRVECIRFCKLQSRVRTHAALMIGLHELLGNPTT